MHFRKGNPESSWIRAFSSAGATFRLASARSRVATPRAKRRPFDHFQDKWRSLRMQYSAWRKKPLLCRMQLRVTAERARARSSLTRVRRVASRRACIPLCPFTPRRERKFERPISRLDLYTPAQKLLVSSGGTRVTVVPRPSHIRIRRGLRFLNMTAKSVTPFSGFKCRKI